MIGTIFSSKLRDSNQGGFPSGAIRVGDWKLVERLNQVSGYQPHSFGQRPNRTLKANDTGIPKAEAFGYFFKK